jgi:hypothetical protein
MGMLNESNIKYVKLTLPDKPRSGVAEGVTRWYLVVCFCLNHGLYGLKDFTEGGIRNRSIVFNVCFIFVCLSEPLIEADVIDFADARFLFLFELLI